MDFASKLEESIDTWAIALLSYITWVNYSWLSTAELVIYYKHLILQAIKKD